MFPKTGRGCVPTTFMGATRDARAGGGALEVRFAHPVSLAPDTHSQGHGRPCLQSRHPRRDFSAIGSFDYGNMLVPGLIKFRGVSGYPRRSEESPLRQLPAGPAGDNRVFDFWCGAATG